MSKRKTIIGGEELPNMPWEEKPAGYGEVMWRHSGNPVIGINPLPCAHSIYNSAVVPYRGKFVGVFRVDYKSYMPFLHFGQSQDGINWDIEHERINFVCNDPELETMQYAYDPRVCKIEDTYYITWCNWYHGSTI